MTTEEKLMEDGKPVGSGNVSAESDSKSKVWENRSSDGGSFHTFQLSRNYQDGNGDWQQTGSMRVRDLPHGIPVVRRAIQVYGVEERLPGRGGES